MLYHLCLSFLFFPPTWSLPKWPIHKCWEHRQQLQHGENQFFSGLYAVIAARLYTHNYIVYDITGRLDRWFTIGLKVRKCAGASERKKYISYRMELFILFYFIFFTFCLFVRVCMWICDALCARHNRYSFIHHLELERVMVHCCHLDQPDDIRSDFHWCSAV